MHQETSRENVTMSQMRDRHSDFSRLPETLKGGDE